MTSLLGARGGGEVSAFGTLQWLLRFGGLRSAMVLSICDGGRGVAQRRCRTISAENCPSARSVAFSAATFLGSRMLFDGGYDLLALQGAEIAW